MCTILIYKASGFWVEEHQYIFYPDSFLEQLVPKLSLAQSTVVTHNYDAVATWICFLLILSMASVIL